MTWRISNWFFIALFCQTSTSSCTMDFSITELKAISQFVTSRLQCHGMNRFFALKDFFYRRKSEKKQERMLIDWKIDVQNLWAYWKYCCGNIELKLHHKNNQHLILRHTGTLVWLSKLRFLWTLLLGGKRIVCKGDGGGKWSGMTNDNRNYWPKNWRLEKIGT